MATLSFQAEPYALEFEPGSTALLMIDMQRDFLEAGGFGELLGNDVSLLRSAIGPCRAVLEAAHVITADNLVMENQHVLWYPYLRLNKARMSLPSGSNTRRSVMLHMKCTRLR